MLAAAPPTRRVSATVNFAVVGQERSGAAVLRSCLAKHDQAFCFGDVLYEPSEPTEQEREEAEAVRRRHYESYFGPAQVLPGKSPHWFEPTNHAAASYLTTFIYRRTQNNEIAMGVHLPYTALARHALYSFLEDETANLRLIWVRRNPITCLVSLAQARRNRVWAAPYGSRRMPPRPGPVLLDPEETTRWCRQHAALEHQIGRLRCRKLVIPYRDLLCDTYGTCIRACQYLGLSVRYLAPDTARLANWPIDKRVVRWAELLASLPSDVRELIHAEPMC